jgi:hypothetical protein
MCGSHGNACGGAQGSVRRASPGGRLCAPMSPRGEAARKAQGLWRRPRTISKDGGGAVWCACARTTSHIGARTHRRRAHVRRLAPLQARRQRAGGGGAPPRARQRAQRRRREGEGRPPATQRRRRRGHDWLAAAAAGPRRRARHAGPRRRARPLASHHHALVLTTPHTPTRSTPLSTPTTHAYDTMEGELPAAAAAGAAAALARTGRRALCIRCRPTSCSHRTLRRRGRCCEQHGEDALTPQHAHVRPQLVIDNGSGMCKGELRRPPACCVRSHPLTCALASHSRLCR